MQDACKIIPALNARKEAAHKKDGHKIALVIESGGMAGVVTGAQVTAIHDLGLTQCFDSIYATSAGAAAASYLLAGIPAVGTSIYFDDLPAVGFLSFRRMLIYLFCHLRGTKQTVPPAMNLSFLFDILTGKNCQNKQLDFEKIIASGMLKIVVTDLDERRAKTVETFKSVEEYIFYLQASCLVPGIAGQPLIDKNGHRLVDGKVTRNSPVQLALDEGHDMVLVLSSRPEGSTLKQTGLAALIDIIVVQCIRLVARNLSEANELATFAVENARENHEEIESAKKNSKVLFLGLPKHNKRVASTCMNASLLRQCASTAYYHAINILSNYGAHAALPSLWENR